MKKYKGIIFDLDGTAIPNRENGMPSENVIRAVQQAKKTSIVSAATGRPIDISRHILKALTVEAPCVTNAGSLIYDMKEDKVLYQQKIPAETVRQILKISFNYSYPIYIADGRQVDKTYICEEDIGSICVWGGDEAGIVEILSQLGTIKDIAAHKVTSWKKGGFDIHITHSLADKAHTVKKLLEILNLAPEEVIGIGDSNNDIPLLSSVGFKVAMGNATDELKQIADYIAPSVEEDGLASVIEEFLS